MVAEADSLSHPYRPCLLPRHPRFLTPAASPGPQTRLLLPQLTHSRLGQLLHCPPFHRNFCHTKRQLRAGQCDSQPSVCRPALHHSCSSDCAVTTPPSVESLLQLPETPGKSLEAMNAALDQVDSAPCCLYVEEARSWLLPPLSPAQAPARTRGGRIFAEVKPVGLTWWSEVPGETVAAAAGEMTGRHCKVVVAEARM